MGWYIKEPWTPATPTTPVTASPLATGFSVTGGTTAKTLIVDQDGTVSTFASGGHTQGTDTALGTLGTKNPPIDADKAVYRDSTASDALVTSTWTQVKAFLKTYFDTLYNLYVHPNHSGDVTSTADGAQVIVSISGKYIYRADGTDVPIADGGTGASTAQTAINALTAVSSATNEYVLTKDTATGNATFKVATGGVTGVRVNKTQADSPYTVIASNLTGLCLFTNTGASGQCIFQLPAGADGYKFRGVVTAAQYMQFLCNGTEKIRFLDVQTAAGGYVRSNTVGNVIEGEWSGTEWVITGIGGAWLYDE